MRLSRFYSTTIYVVTFFSVCGFLVSWRQSAEAHRLFGNMTYVTDCPYVAEKVKLVNGYREVGSGLLHYSMCYARQYVYGDFNQDGLKDAEAGIDGTFQDREMLWSLMEVIQIPNVHYAEEVAFLVKGDGGVLIVGDIVCGGRKDRGVPDGELWINGPEYVADLQEARISVQRLQKYPFEVMCFGHGTPIAYQPKAVLRRFIESDTVWEKLKVEKAERADSLPH